MVVPLGELGAAVRAAGGFELSRADGAFGPASEREVLPSAEDSILERRPRRLEEAGCRMLLRPCGNGHGSVSEGRAHETLLKTPTTRPSTAASRVVIGFMLLFSGCSRIWSFSRKYRFTVDSSSPTRATTISPLCAVSDGRTTAKSPSRMPASIMLSPRTRRM